MTTYDQRHDLDVASRLDDLDAKVVALLHDALEDRACTIDELERAELPDAIYRAVLHLIRTLTRDEASK